MAANEASAVGTLRTYHATLSSFAEQCPDLAYPSNLAKLGPVEGAKDKCARTFLLDQTLTVQLPVKAGYHFFYMPQAGSSGSIMKYVLAADPVAPGASGVRHFFTDQSRCSPVQYAWRSGREQRTVDVKRASRLESKSCSRGLNLRQKFRRERGFPWNFLVRW